jgi:peroxiredoxin
MAAKKSVRRATGTKKARVRSVSKAPVVTQHLLPAGTKAPDFTLKSTPDQSLSLSEFRGRPVILAFYPADWSPTCGDQLALYNEVLPEFERYKAELIGISVDGTWCHAAYAKARNLHFPLLADFEPKGAVAKAYGAYMPATGMSGRALFVLDGKGTIRWSYLSPMNVNPGADGILAALESLGPAARPAARPAAHPSALPAEAGAGGKHRAAAPSGRPAVRTEEREAR